MGARGTAWHWVRGPWHFFHRSQTTIRRGTLGGCFGKRVARDHPERQGREHDGLARVRKALPAPKTRPPCVKWLNVPPFFPPKNSNSPPTLEFVVVGIHGSAWDCNMTFHGSSNLARFCSPWHFFLIAVPFNSSHTSIRCGVLWCMPLGVVGNGKAARRHGR